MHPADKLSLACSFQNDSNVRTVYGESSDDEMCI
jgi:hypothetical protein